METIATFGASGHDAAALQLFEQADQARVAALLRDCPVVRVAAGAAVADEHEDARLYVVLRGMLEVTPAEARPGTDRTASRVLPGECVGELAVLDGEAMSDHVLALQESELLVIDGPTLWRLVDESNGVARNLLRLLSFRIRAANAQLRRRQKLGEFYRQLSMVDGLTGLQNRAWLNAHLPLLLEQAQAAGEPLSLVMIDIDHFKHFNDEYGHLVGDTALQTAARAIAAALRPSDFAARFGGEELIVILPGTGQKGAALVAQRLCEQIRQAVVFTDMHKPLPHITASFGLATLGAGQTVDALVALADAALYRAKQAGRNRVAV
ncbi:GGDEF domain-containing protein [Oxalobacteraceae bacterium OM1]|nr:GGDEF domain-containing protein [Oxalobacteraceae bacterium OM1]